MLISDLRTIIIDRPVPPCTFGLEWFDKTSQNHKHTTSFFKSLKNTKKENGAYTPYGYLIWIFWECLDWREITDTEYSIFDDPNYEKFMQKNFNVPCALKMKVPNLCEALVRAFK